MAAAVGEGLPNSEIAEWLFMSVGSVKAHISSVLTKLDLANRIQLARPSTGRFRARRDADGTSTAAKAVTRPHTTRAGGHLR